MRLTTLLLLLLLASGAHAQSDPGWSYQHDPVVTQQSGGADARDTAWTFVAMPPGWHITTGPGATFFHPGNAARGAYSLASEIFLFPDPTEEGYGIFFGGSGVGTDSATYLAVLLRRDGAVSLQRYDRGALSIVAPWTRHAAIVANPGDKVVRNTLRLRVAGDSLRVSVNDSIVMTVPRGALRTDGQVGLRAGRGLNLHVTTLDHTVHHAPIPAGK